MSDESISEAARERAIERRRAFHRYPEPSWCEFHTTSRLVEYIEAVGVDDLFVGQEAIRSADRLGVTRTF